MQRVMSLVNESVVSMRLTVFCIFFFYGWTLMKDLWGLDVN